MLFPSDFNQAAFDRWAETVAKPAIMARAEWGAKPPVRPWKVHQGTRITVHHAGVPTNRNRTFAQMLTALQTFSQRVDQLAGGREKPAWPDIPYHWYIGWQGSIADCRDPKIVGDTNTEYDPSGHLLVCLEGNFETEEPTGAQIRALDEIVTYLVARYRVHPELIQSHRDFATTSCPGEKLYSELPRIRARIALRLHCAGVAL